MTCKYNYFGERQLITVVDNRNDYFDSKKGPVINWGAIGEVPVEKAEEFVKQMQEAIKFAKTLK